MILGFDERITDSALSTVVSVGIHARSAREKLHEPDKQAQIMSDEVTRKLLQSVKRCISFAQTRWPPDDLGQLMG